MTKPLAPGPDYSYATTYPTSPEDRQGRHLIRRSIGAGAAVLVAGSALAVGLQAARPDALQAPSPASTGVDAPTSTVPPAPTPPRPAEHDDDDEAGAPISKVAPVRAAPVAAPAPAPVASTGGS